MRSYANVALGIVVVSAIVIVISCMFFNYQVSPVSNDETDIVFDVPTGSTFSTIGDKLEEIGVIRSSSFYRFYIKIFTPDKLEAGKYTLNKAMSMREIIKTLESGSNYNPDAVMLTIPEGRNMEQVASIVSNNTNVSANEFLEYVNDATFLDEVIANYWFVTEDVKQSDIRYALEGYLFPSTYELQNEDVDARYIILKMLDQMALELEPFKNDIENSEYSAHELLTMASIVEYEAILDEDRALVASVFYNRLDIGQKLQSCATLGYALGEFKLTYTNADMQVDSPYNTYYYAGLPVGPGCMPSRESIEAAIYPEDSDYYYFMANVCDPTSQKTYFSKTYAEHQEKVDKYLTCF